MARRPRYAPGVIFQGRRKRYAVVIGVGVLGLSIAVYFLIAMHPYKDFDIWNFDSNANGTAPDGFFSLGSGEKGYWTVKADDSAPSKPNVLAKLATKTDNKNIDEAQPNYQMLINEGNSYDRFRASVTFKIIPGGTDQAAGLVFRFEDSSRYFVLLADATNDRFSLCIAETDKLICRSEVDVYKVTHKHVTTGEWHTITAWVAHQGIAGYLDDTLLVRNYDAHYITGQIGLWTKGDTEVYFDNLKIQH